LAEFAWPQNLSSNFSTTTMISNMTHLKIMLLLLCSVISAQAQNNTINSKNYCSFYNEEAYTMNAEVITRHLSAIVITDIVREEMYKLGFKWLSTPRIIKIETGQYVASICYSDKSNCGFLLEESFDLIPLQETRSIVSINKRESGYDYSEKIVFTDGKYEFVNIKEIPKNLHILKMDNYWYQTSTNKDKSKALVPKEFAFDLLKEDVRDFLKDKL